MPVGEEPLPTTTRPRRAVARSRARRAERSIPIEAIDRLVSAVMRWHRLPEVKSFQDSMYRSGDEALSPTQVDILSTLCRTSELTMREVSEQIGIDPALVSRNVPRLVELRLVTRGSSTRDGRVVIVSATPNGHELYARIVEMRRAVGHALLQLMPPDKMIEFVDLFETMVNGYVTVSSYDPSEVFGPSYSVTTRDQHPVRDPRPTSLP